MSLSAYLAANYLTASNSSSPLDPNSRPKKRRKKDKPTAVATSTLIIADDDDDLSLSNSKSHLPDSEDESNLALDSSHRSAEFRRTKKNNWKSLQPGSFNSVSSTNPASAEDVEANRILAAAAAATDAAHAELAASEAPAIVETADTGTAPLLMPSGARAGLQTVADTAELERAEEQRRLAERKTARRAKKGDAPAEEEETVYRDATGRRIDVSMKRAEARAAAAAAVAAERREAEAKMGDVQLRARDERRAQLEDAQFLSLARHVDDDAMNDELRARLHWDDPMAAYMAEKAAAAAAAAAAEVKPSSERRSVGRGEEARDGRTGPKPPQPARVYAGAAPPNRYGIKPGWRWDGVDRGNGFEKEWFQARGQKSRNERLAYEWQQDE